MRPIKLYIAISLDGKIARLDGDVNWLSEVPNNEQTDHGYSEFLQSIDTVFMGHNTYKKIESFGGDYPYPDKDGYVFTTDPSIEGTENVSFVSGEVTQFIQKIKNKKGGNIWLIGGGILNTTLLNSGLIDELIVFVMPIIIGQGIQLFEGEVDQTLLELVATKTWSTGAVQLNYKIAKDVEER